MKNNSYSVSGNIIDIVNREIFQGTLNIKNGKVIDIIREKVEDDHYILPGLIDSHIHIESSMLIPSEFARLAVRHGTIASVSDPHEIANVLGMEGIRFMIKNGKKVPFKFYFGASSCVPATKFETSGANLGVKEIDELLQMDDIHYLSEMMNFPGVLFGDKEVMGKIATAKKYNKPIDGHAPGLKGEDAKKYIAAGISTDHECFTMEEALDKVKNGMKILIREGSAAKNFEALIDLIKDYPDKVMFCSDDRHPNDLVKGHINEFVKRAFKKGYDKFDVLRAASLNPVKHYNMDIGLLQKGDNADFIIVDDLENFNIKATYIDGVKVADKKTSFIESQTEKEINNFSATKIQTKDIKISPQKGKIKVIQALDGQLITKMITGEAKIEKDNVISDIENDFLKIVVYNRYKPAKPSIAFINNFGFKSGAIASSVAHDSHNIIAVGVDDSDIVEAINLLVEKKGGISLAKKNIKKVLPLPIAGLMSAEDGYLVAKKYEELDMLTKTLGTQLNASYMTLAFMALLVIPEIKLSDLGLFDGNKFEFTSLFFLKKNI
ncbi:MAG: adenine deaminase [Bacteroidales bacterium]|nr:adenine deaminase [Bacteroidales bacterium]